MRQKVANSINVFIHSSIKTRIETNCHRIAIAYIRVFIHSSIKTRIETRYGIYNFRNNSQFLYIVPLKQGLKLTYLADQQFSRLWFLYIVPLKQGLKLQSFQGIEDLSKLFLYIVPLKQGLKRGDVIKYEAIFNSFYTQFH